MKLKQILSVVLLSTFLFACGSDDGTYGYTDTSTDTSSDTSDDSSDSSSDDTSDDTSSDDSSSDDTSSGAVTLTLQILDCPSDWSDDDISLCSEISEISKTNAGIVAATLTLDDEPLEREIVSITLTKGELTSSVDSLTNIDGIAFFTLTSGDDEGAGRITASSDAEGDSTETYINYNIGSSNLEISISDDTDGVELAQNATAVITVDLTEDGEAYLEPVTVTFTSTCAESDLANLDSSVTAVNGVAQAIYQATGCAGDDVITASTDLTDSFVSTTVTVAVAPAASINFISTTPSFLALQGTGGSGREETSVVVFEVVDANGTASSLQEVEFELENAPSGTTIEPLTATTNSDGQVYTVISSGKVPGVVKVKAKVVDSDPIISSISSELVVSTGLPDQNSFSLSLSDHSPESLNIDGIEIAANVLLADKFNNAVPDGTVIYFTAEGGAIRDEDGIIGSCQTVGSGCAVNWVSQNPRPNGNMLSSFNSTGECGYYAADPYRTNTGPCINEGGMGQPYGGRVTITAFTQGEETFVDNDGDGWYSDGDTFLTEVTGFLPSYDLAEVFFDNNEDGFYKTEDGATNTGDEEEEFYDFSPVDGEFTEANGIYNGLLCSEESELAGSCTTDLVSVRDEQVLIMASSTQYIRVQDSILGDIGSLHIEDDDKFYITAYFADIYNNRPPTGTVITISTTNGQILSSQTEWVLGSSSALGPFSIEFVVGPEDTLNDKTYGQLSIELETPEGGTLTFLMDVTDEEPEE